MTDDDFDRCLRNLAHHAATRAGSSPLRGLAERLGGRPASRARPDREILATLDAGATDDPHAAAFGVLASRAEAGDPLAMLALGAIAAATGASDAAERWCGAAAAGMLLPGGRPPSLDAVRDLALGDEALL